MRQILENRAAAGYNSLMREITFETLAEAAADCVKACLCLPEGAKAALKAARAREENEAAAFALDMLLENAETAEREGLALCQDTGMAVFFVTLGLGVRFTGGRIEDAINEGVRRGYRRYGCRASVLDPLTRVNTGDNTPAIVHIETEESENITLDFLPKGFGSENMTRLYMLTPSAGIRGIADCVEDAVRAAGSKPCPPVIVGVGIGGTSEKAAELAKRQHLREIGAPSPDPELAALERECLERVNALGIGVQGFGGKNTALAVHIGKYPTHITALPVAVNIQCNAARKSHKVI